MGGGCTALARAATHIQAGGAWVVTVAAVPSRIHTSRRVGHGGVAVAAMVRATHTHPGRLVGQPMGIWVGGWVVTCLEARPGPQLQCSCMTNKS